MRLSVSSMFACSVSAALLSLLPAGAATFTLNSSDASGSTSFNAAGNWSSGAAPANGNDYVDTGFDLRTPANALDSTFGGSTATLTLNSGGKLLFKGTTTTGTGAKMTVNTLNLNGGIVANGATTWTLQGNVNLQSGGGIFDAGNAGSTTFVSSGIMGTGALTLQASAVTGTNHATIQLNGTNGYSGGTLVTNGASVAVSTDGGLGSGNVTLTGTAILTLQSGATNNYLSDSAILSLASTAGLVLNFTGTDTVGELSLNGGSTFLSAGTWGAVGSSAQFTSSLITGTGLLNVAAVPEGGTAALLGMAAALAGAMPLWRRLSGRVS